jgi:phosphate/sulfate permease
MWKKLLKIFIGLVIIGIIGGGIALAVINYQTNMNKSFSGAKYINMLHWDA